MGEGVAFEGDVLRVGERHVARCAGDFLEVADVVGIVAGARDAEGALVGNVAVGPARQPGRVLECKPLEAEVRGAVALDQRLEQRQLDILAVGIRVADEVERAACLVEVPLVLLVEELVGVLELGDAPERPLCRCRRHGSLGRGIEEGHAGRLVGRGRRVGVKVERNRPGKRIDRYDPHDLAVGQSRTGHDHAWLDLADIGVDLGEMIGRAAVRERDRRRAVGRLHERRVADQVGIGPGLRREFDHADIRHRIGGRHALQRHGGHFPLAVDDGLDVLDVGPGRGIAPVRTIRVVDDVRGVLDARHAGIFLEARPEADRVARRRVGVGLGARRALAVDVKLSAVDAGADGCLPELHARGEGEARIGDWCPVVDRHAAGDHRMLTRHRTIVDDVAVAAGIRGTEAQRVLELIGARADVDDDVLVQRARRLQDRPHRRLGLFDGQERVLLAAVASCATVRRRYPEEHRTAPQGEGLLARHYSTWTPVPAQELAFGQVPGKPLWRMGDFPPFRRTKIQDGGCFARSARPSYVVFSTTPM